MWYRARFAASILANAESNNTPLDLQNHDCVINDCVYKSLNVCEWERNEKKKMCALCIVCSAICATVSHCIAHCQPTCLCLMLWSAYSFDMFVLASLCKRILRYEDHITLGIAFLWFICWKSDNRKDIRAVRSTRFHLPLTFISIEYISPLNETLALVVNCGRSPIRFFYMYINMNEIQVCQMSPQTMQ